VPTREIQISGRERCGVQEMISCRGVAKKRRKQQAAAKTVKC
jgi:hypothetical protein